MSFYIVTYSSLLMKRLTFIIYYSFFLFFYFLFIYLFIYLFFYYSFFRDGGVDFSEFVMFVIDEVVDEGYAHVCEKLKTVQRKSIQKASSMSKIQCCRYEYIIRNKNYRIQNTKYLPFTPNVIQ